jgi:hypothetical protein
MKRTLKYSSLPLPAIKLIVTKEPKNGTAVHIGWKNEDGKAFCLCGHEVGVINTKGRWEEVTVNTHPEITCGRCKRIWNSDRIRSVDAKSPRWLVFNRIEREHLKNESDSNNTSYQSDPSQHAYDEEHLTNKYGPHRFDRKLPCEQLLVGMKPYFRKEIHLASRDANTGTLTAMCDHTCKGDTIGTTEKEYHEYPYITCPSCIEYIKEHELDAAKEEMERRSIELANRVKCINELAEELEEAKRICESLSKRTLYINN